MTEWGQYPTEREIETLKEDEEKQSERERERGGRGFRLARWEPQRRNPTMGIMVYSLIRVIWVLKDLYHQQ